jgi:uncharacterized membrane protein YvbJ
MFCKNCGKNLNLNSKFCTNCGHEIVRQPLTQNLKVEIIDQQVGNPSLTVCQTCGAYAPVKYVEFYQNIGMLFRRQQRSIKGKLCKNCINKYFRKFTIVNLTLGWWGMISFFATVIFLVNNTFRYLAAVSLKKI